MNQWNRSRRHALPMLLVSLLAPTAYAQTANSTPTGSLTIDPALCVLTSEQDQCTTPLHIRWQLPANESTTICLYIADQTEPLFCDSNAPASGDRHLQLALTQNTEFELRRQDDLNVLARATVTIARQLSDLRPRRRHGWGIF